jgi:prepilin signal peptidase PulO-like enzyme (type II secretory pathway)
MIIWTLIFGLSKIIYFNLLHSLAGMTACFILFLLPAALKKHVGAGDIKLAAALGFSAGIPGCLYAIALMGILIILYIMITGREPLLLMVKKLVPMGPFMAAALIAVQAVI